MQVRAQLFKPELERQLIQPVNRDGSPATLLEIAQRVRALKYRCQRCHGILGARVEATPTQNGVRVNPYPGRYRVTVICIWCGQVHELSDLIRAHQGGAQK